jgi:hypothetical protein
MNEQRKPYFEETQRTISLMEGRTISKIYQSNDMVTNEISGVTIVFTDGAHVVLRAEVVDNGREGRDNGPDAALDISHGQGLYDPRNPRQATNAAGEVVELS